MSLDQYAAITALLQQIVTLLTPQPAADTPATATPAVVPPAAS